MTKPSDVEISRLQLMKSKEECHQLQMENAKLKKEINKLESDLLKEISRNAELMTFLTLSDEI